MTDRLCNRIVKRRVMHSCPLAGVKHADRHHRPFRKEECRRSYAPAFHQCPATKNINRGSVRQPSGSSLRCPRRSTWSPIAGVLQSISTTSIGKMREPNSILPRSPCCTHRNCRPLRKTAIGFRPFQIPVARSAMSRTKPNSSSVDSWPLSRVQLPRSFACSTVARERFEPGRIGKTPFTTAVDDEPIATILICVVA